MSDMKPNNITNQLPHSNSVDLDSIIEARKEKRNTMLQNMSPAALSVWEKGTLSREQQKIIEDLPWATLSKPFEKVDFAKARQTLSSAHYGMQRIKDKILHLLAVRQRTGITGRAILLAGPPGTGKTTIAKSIAKVLNEPYYKISCQGLVSAWELLGSTPTWNNASYGQIVSAIKTTNSFSAVVVIDEVDKFEKTDRNPQMGLLSILDSTNNEFVDNFLQLPIDLSHITFILTANSLDDISPIIRDRVDIIEIPGYTRDEKHHILTEYIFPELMTKYMLSASEVVFTPEAIDAILDNSTEQGAREIHHIADNLYRKAVYLLELGAKTIPITKNMVSEEFGNKSAKPTVKIGFAA